MQRNSEFLADKVGPSDGLQCWLYTFCLVVVKHDEKYNLIPIDHIRSRPCRGWWQMEGAIQMNLLLFNLLGGENPVAMNRWREMLEDASNGSLSLGIGVAHKQICNAGERCQIVVLEPNSFWLFLEC